MAGEREPKDGIVVNMYYTEKTLEIESARPIAVRSKT